LVVRFAERSGDAGEGSRFIGRHDAGASARLPWKPVDEVVCAA
jgi:hypothetical protein